MDNCDGDNYDEGLQKFMEMPIEAAKSRAGPTINQLKAWAVHLNLSKTHPKDKLVDMIHSQMKGKLSLDAVEDEEDESNFRKDRNTFARICNFAMEVSGLERSQLLATRSELQAKEINYRLPVY